jgi:hypothetical protein
MNKNITHFLNLPFSSKKKPVLAAILAFVFPPFGFLYLSKKIFFLILLFFFITLPVPPLAFFILFIFGPVFALYLSNINNKMIESGIRPYIDKHYDAEAKVSEVKNKFAFRWFKSLEKPNILFRMLAGYTSLNKCLHYIGVTEDDELHLGFYSGQQHVFKNYIARVYKPERRVIFKISANKSGADECIFTFHEQDKEWKEISNRINAEETKTWVQKIGKEATNLFKIKCPKCKEKGYVESIEVSKSYLDKIYKETGISKLSGGLKSLGGPTMGSSGSQRTFAWFFIYDLTNNHNCNKCGHAWQSIKQIEEQQH